MKSDGKAAVRTRRAVLELLKQEGASDSAALAARLGVSAMAVRQHLYGLRDERLVTYDEEARPLGRPAKLWRLTPEADRLFTDGHAELTVGLLGAMRDAFGEAGLTRLLAVRTRQQVSAYQARVPARGPLPSAASVSMTPAKSQPGRAPASDADRARLTSPRFNEIAVTRTVASFFAAGGSSTSRRASRSSLDGSTTTARID